jgi:hypothetical protein
MMAELSADKLHDTTIFNGTDMAVKPGAFSYQKKHC